MLVILWFQGEARYATGIPSSMLLSAAGVEADGIEKFDTTTITEVEREAYVQGTGVNIYSKKIYLETTQLVDFLI